MKYKSQNNETEIVLKYFNGRKGTVLEIGANDGITFSNSYDLIQRGWSAILVEPSSVFEDLKNLYRNHPQVSLQNIAIGTEEGRLKFYESGAHIKDGVDRALVSTAVEEELEKRKDVDFRVTEVPVTTFESFRKDYAQTNFDYISIDVEGMDLQVLSQIDLNEVGCDCLCIEYNMNTQLANQFILYCRQFGLKEHYVNLENIIFVR
ncbi:FkbM family methyltransferase [Pedobacter sp. FW305-3-2-15-E-R2A2]|uniref:FkbM family methyltransferase n=1 Tax=Pedobacter sp. FW305-3-2-15-E-R2A2 TaxID=3140251 RepID=UPI0031401BB5